MGCCDVRGDVNEGVCEAPRECNALEVDGLVKFARVLGTGDWRGPAVLGRSAALVCRCERLFSDCTANLQKCCTEQRFLR